MTEAPGVGVLLPFAVAFVASLVCTAIARRVAPALGLVARPRADRWHRGEIPLLGGLAIVAGTLAGIAALRVQDPLLLVAAGAGLAMAGVGLADDVLRLKPSSKLIAQIAVACLVVLSQRQLHVGSSDVFNAAMTLVWLVGVTNAFNLVDNMDGLCAGVAALAALALGVTATTPELAGAAFALAGSAGGFLLFNRHPASIFMGDAGSLFLGMTIAVLSIGGSAEGQAGFVSVLVVPVLVMLIPIFDTAFVTLTRRLSARAVSSGGRDHTSHRLVALGFPEPAAVRVLHLLAACGCITAVVVSRWRHTEGLLLLPALLFAIALLGLVLARVRVYGGDDFSVLREGAYTPLLVGFTHRRRVVEIVVDTGLIAFAYWAAFVLRFDGGVWAESKRFGESLPVVVGCSLVSFFLVGVYRGAWRHFSPADAITLIRGVVLGTLSSVVALVALYRFESYSRGVFAIFAMALMLLMVFSRGSIRLLKEWASLERASSRRAIVVGAGHTGALLVRELRSNHTLDLRAVAFVDDNPLRQGRHVLGVKVAGGIDDLEKTVASCGANAVVLATRRLGDLQLRRVERVCEAHGLELLRFDVRLQHEASVHRLSDDVRAAADTGLEVR